MTTEELLQRYSMSFFADQSCAGWFDANDEAKKGGMPPTDPRRIDSRAIGGSRVPLVKGRELVAAMIENVEESRFAMKATGERLQRAKRDGLLNMKAFKQEDEETQTRWLAAISTVKGDYGRAVAEMNHWQEYAQLASEGKLPTLKDNSGSGWELIKQLAESKAFEPDRRLPPEAA